jgi:hypothetical protein
MLSIDDNQMIETLASNIANHSLDVWILKRRSRRGDHFFDLHPCHSEAKSFSVDLISISEQIAWRCIFRKCFDHLLRRPDGRRMQGDIEVDNLSSIMKQEDETVQDAKWHRVDSEEIDGRNLLSPLVTAGVRPFV